MIGEPEKCDGLVSLRGLRRLGFLPEAPVIQSRVNKAIIHSPEGTELSVGASTLDVVVIDRSAFDRQVGEMARAAGAEVLTGTRVAASSDSGETVRVDLGGKQLVARYYIDATGPASSPRGGIVPAAKYEVRADWVHEGAVEIFLDAERYPGFFAWVIPFGENLAKVGVAGRGINSREALEAFLLRRKHTVLRKVMAPIYIGGPVSAFTSGRRIMVGESAGMVKPTTAGGIVTSLGGASIAARCVSEAVEREDPRALLDYQREWEALYGTEMLTMKRLRGLFEQLSNRQLDSLVKVLAAPRVAARLSESDFDFHATGLVKALGVRGVLKLARIGVAAEARSLLVNQ